MARIDSAEIWGLNYRLLLSAMAAVSPGVDALGIETKELFVLGEIDAHPHPAELADVLNMPKATVLLYLKRLEQAGLVTRDRCRRLKAPSSEGDPRPRAKRCAMG